MITATILMLGITLVAIFIMEYQLKQVKVRTSEYLKGYKFAEYDVFYSPKCNNTLIYETDSVISYFHHSSCEVNGFIYLGKL